MCGVEGREKSYQEVPGPGGGLDEKLPRGIAAGSVVEAGATRSLGGATVTRTESPKSFSAWVVCSQLVYEMLRDPPPAVRVVLLLVWRTMNFPVRVLPPPLLPAAAAALIPACKSDGQCAASEACHVSGLCTGHLTKCIVGSDADCAQSILCRNEGLCVAVERRCRAVEDDDCFRSEACRRKGRCRAVGIGCVEP